MNKGNILKMMSAERQLSKLKREATGDYKSGHGSFTVAFENPVYAELLVKQDEL